MVNNKPREKRTFKRLTAFVEQRDLLLANLTVRETLRFQAQLRLPSDWSREEKEEVVEGVITELGLENSADTFVGGPMV